MGFEGKAGVLRELGVADGVGNVEGGGGGGVYVVFGGGQDVAVIKYRFIYVNMFLNIC